MGRLLKKAREEGIVEITVHTHPALSMQLEGELMRRFGLRQALLVSDQRDAETQRAQFGRGWWPASSRATCKTARL